MRTNYFGYEAHPHAESCEGDQEDVNARALSVPHAHSAKCVTNVDAYADAYADDAKVPKVPKAVPVPVATQIVTGDRWLEPLNVRIQQLDTLVPPAEMGIPPSVPENGGGQPIPRPQGNPLPSVPSS